MQRLTYRPEHDAVLRGLREGPTTRVREFYRVLAPRGRLQISLVNPPFEAMSRIGRRLSSLVGEPATWPTRRRMRRRVADAGFRVEDRRLVLRIPATLVLPSILTIATRPG